MHLFEMVSLKSNVSLACLRTQTFYPRKVYGRGDSEFEQSTSQVSTHREIVCSDRRMDCSSLIVGAASVLCESMAMAERIRFAAGNLSQDSSDLQTAMEELKAIRDDLKEQIERDELAGRTCTNHAREWMNAVQVAEAKTGSIMEKLAQRMRRRRRRLCGCLRRSCCADYKLSKMVSATLKGIRELGEKAGNINIDGGVHLEPSEEVPIRPAIGLTTMIEQIWRFLAEEETGMIGIYGTGGVGKTTLLQNINNELTTKSHLYDIVIWVTVSRDLVVCNIQYVVGTRLGLSWDEREMKNGEQRASKIYRVMKRKRFLLLLDDVWEEVDFEKIGIPRPNEENKCKVIFTTRSMSVCCAMGAQRKLKVEFLDQEKSWELFCDKAGRREYLESPSIHILAKSLVRKCGGSPIALITIGRAMAHRETEEEWIYAIEALNKSPTDVRGIQDVFALLKFSYDNLENDLLRVCFLYCALFPEDYAIEIEELVEYWIGEGFLASSHGSSAIYKGYTLLGDLKATCLLETGEERTQVKIHDVTRSFALWMLTEQGSDKELILAEPGMSLTEAPKAEKWRRAFVISLMDNRIAILPTNPICPTLTTLMLQRNSSLEEIPMGFFTHMPALRVLDLSFTSLTEIPSSIECLVELCHLALSRTNISALPKELGNQKNLKHLDLQRTQFLQTIPKEAICGLHNLEVLNLYYSYASWELQRSEPDGEEEELRVSDLENLKNLTTLGLTILSLEALRMLHEFIIMHNQMQYLYIEGCKGLLNLDFPPNSSNGRRLRRLSIKSCHDLEYLLAPVETENGWLPCLEVLTLHSLHNLTRVWSYSLSQDCLRNLRCLNIGDCHKLKNITWVLQLPKLEVIHLFCCKELEEVIGKDGQSHSVEDSSSFPSLRTLSMRDLPELRNILPSKFSFPKLETLAAIDCPKLKKLPFLATMQQTKLPTVYGNREWWDALEWDEANVELSCLLHFVPN